MVKLLDRVKQAVSGTASNTTLGAAAEGFRTFNTAGAATNDVCRYAIEDDNGAFEIGTIVINSATTGTRTVQISSNSNNALTLTGNAVIFATLSAADLSGNAAPIWTTTPPSNISLNPDGSTAVTIAGVAIDEFPIQYSWYGYSGTSVYNDDSLPPQLGSAPTFSGGTASLVSTTNTSNSGEFNFRMKASDGVKTATAITTVKLVFDYTTGLVGLYDADDSNSYSGSGTSWSDISGNNNAAMTLGSAVVYNSSGHGGKGTLTWGGTNGVIGTTNANSGSTGTVLVITRHNEVLSSTSSIYQSRLFCKSADGTGSFLTMSSNQGNLFHATQGYQIYWLDNSGNLTTSSTKLYVDKVDKTQVNRSVGRELLYETSAVRAKLHSIAISSVDFSTGFSLCTSNGSYSGTGEVRAIRIYDHALTQAQVSMVHDFYAEQYSTSDMQA